VKYLPIAASLALLSGAELTLAQSKNQSVYDELTVTSSRIAVPMRQIATSVTIINREELELKGYSSIANLLRTEASIAVSNSGGQGKATALRIRGEEGFRTLVLVDGVNMSDPTSTQIAPQIENLLTSYDVERVEVLRGPQVFMYGADAGGVVNIITRSAGESFAGGVSLESGSYGTVNTAARLSGGSKALDYSLAITSNESDGFNARADDTSLMDDDGYENRTIHAKLGWNITEAVRASLVLRDIDADTQYDNCGFPSVDACDAFSKQQNAKLKIEYKTALGSHSVSYAKTNIDREILESGIKSFAIMGETSEVEYLGSYGFSDAQTLVFGADYEEYKIVSSGEASDRDQKGIFVEYQHSFDDRLFFTAGARQDDNSDFGTHTSWRLSAAYVQDLASGNTFKLRSTFGNGFRAPSLSEIAYNFGPFAFGNAARLNLQEETSKGFDVGIEYQFESGAGIRLTYFDQQIEDEIFFDLIGFSGYLQAIGSSQSNGVEFELDIPLGVNFGITANFTYNETQTPQGITRARRPEQLANLGLRYSSDDKNLSLLANYRVANDAFDEIFGVGLVPLDDYQVLDISANYRITDAWQLFGRIQNLTNEDYQEVTGFNSAGRNAYAGVRLSF
jgi:vitamin B12 transporter